MIEVYIDGASTGNPGQAGAGIFIKANGTVKHYSIPLGEMTSHEAEFWALIKALEICTESSYSVVSFRTDSKIVEDTVEKRYAKREPFKTLIDKAVTYIDNFDLFFIKWVPSKSNPADQLAKKAIQLNRK
ncbi:reverse transcriptase-like protein [Anaerobacillus sp. CMMVII]|uniref:reverse transcriptase-like protein n=1 Tax=Anaerobacillus sp. CMMVII TaxID=2755588 RepID=UPI0021B824B5|nr:reverse transcriptase-like protein [Anaerobacillus sp. CMMVII]MCT8137982.1 reverse transcriptase-like protein [Anaerobacillus sp. CMMVII]